MVTRVSTFAVAVLIPALLFAQGVASWDLSAQLMHSPRASRPNDVFGAQTAGITQSALAIRASTDLLRIGAVRIRYAAQVLPAIRLRNVERYARFQTDVATAYVVSAGAHATGIGLVPIGLELSADLPRRARIQIGAGAGIAWFTQNVPVAAARQRNFTAEWDGALLLHAGHDRWIQLGMRWKHISNGQTAWENPGIDNRMLFAGMSWRVHAPR